MCSAHAWQFLTASGTWYIKSCRQDTPADDVILHRGRSLPLLGKQWWLIISIPVKVPLQWGKTICSPGKLRLSRLCSWPLWGSLCETLVWSPPLTSPKLNFSSWNCPEATVCLLEIFWIDFELPVPHSPRIEQMFFTEIWNMLKAAQISTEPPLVFLFPNSSALVQSPNSVCTHHWQRQPS